MPNNKILFNNRLIFKAMTLKEKLRAFVRVHLTEFLPTRWGRLAIDFANTGYIEESKLIPLCLFCGVYGFNKKLIEVNDVLHFELFLIEYSVVVDGLKIKLSGQNWELNLNVVAIEAIIVDYDSGIYSYDIVMFGGAFKLRDGRMKLD